jgi:hypothetical protein
MLFSCDAWPSCVRPCFGVITTIDGAAVATAIGILSGIIVRAGTRRAGRASQSSAAIFFVADCRVAQQKRWSHIKGIGIEQKIMTVFDRLGSEVRSSTG